MSDFFGGGGEPDADDSSTPEERALDEYFDLALRGDSIDLDAFCARHGDADGGLRRRIEALRGMLEDGRPGKAPSSAVPAAPPAAAEPGLPFERVGGFRLLRRIGEGGMGVVFLAEQESLGRAVALKVIRPERSASPEARRRFLREAQAIARLRHPHIVSVHAAGEDRGVLFLAMELVPGRGLDEILREAAEKGGRVPLRDAIRWIAQIASALEAAREAGIVHRDVKPANVRITPDGRALLLDFGLARGAGSGSLTVSGEFRGTPFYAAPEQISARPSGIDARTDVYGTGVTLYECTTSAPPFEGETTEQVFQHVLSKEPPRPRKRNPAIPRDLETVILKALEKDPARRYATAGDLACDLEAILELRPIRARPAGAWTRAAKWSRRNRTASVGLATTTLGAIAVAGILLEGRWSEARSYAGEIDAAEQAAAAGDFAGALAAVDRALGIRPDDPAATRRRADIAREQAKASSNAALEDARERFGAYLEARASLAARRASADEAERLFRYESQPREHREAHLGEVEGVAGDQLHVEETFDRVLEALERAARYDPENPTLPETRAEVFFARWEEAETAGDRVREPFYRAKVEENDVEGKWTERMAAKGTLSLEGSPAGAEAYLFRYEPQHRVKPGGERRLVPVPFHPDRGPLAAPFVEASFHSGDVALAVESVVEDSPASRAGVRPGDLIHRFEGVPIEESLLVGEIDPEGAAARAGLRPFDRLVRIAGKEVRSEEGFLWIYFHEHEYGSTISAAFARGAETIEMAVKKERTGMRHLADFGARIGGVEACLRFPLPESGATIEILSEGVDRTVRLEGGAPAGIRAIRTACPTPTSASNHVGALPLPPMNLPPGSYLLLLRKEGFEDLRVPVLLGRNQKARARADLLPAGSTPAGFVWIPPGPFLAGGDLEAHLSWPAGTLETEGYWIARREITVREYLEFLNDPSTLAAVDAAAAEGSTIRVLRDAGRDTPIVVREDGRFVLEANSEWRTSAPLTHVSWEDAVAYCEWRTRQAKAQRRPWVFDLPTEEEWEKAARGVDGRLFPWGDVFDWGYCRGDFSSSPRYRERPLARAVRDESPWGVLDLAGSEAEWCTKPSFGGRARPVRGGSWAHDSPEYFRAAHRDYFNSDYHVAYFGFRLVARPVKSK